MEGRAALASATAAGGRGTRRGSAAPAASGRTGANRRGAVRMAQARSASRLSAPAVPPCRRAPAALPRRAAAPPGNSFLLCDACVGIPHFLCTLGSRLLKCLNGARRCGEAFACPSKKGAEPRTRGSAACGSDMFGRPRTGSAATSLTQARRSGGQTKKERGVLSDRRQRVLAALIEEYVARALPVGSRTLTERYQLGVSPATVRNELSVLEDGGYIAQPHTSAGRIPTDAGYRAFVDNLLVSGLAPTRRATAPWSKSCAAAPPSSTRFWNGRRPRSRA